MGTIQRRMRSREVTPQKGDTQLQVRNKRTQRQTLDEELSQKEERLGSLLYTEDETRDLVHREMDGYIYTRVFNNNYDISYGYISCAIPSDQMDDVFKHSDITKRKEVVHQRQSIFATLTTSPAKTQH